MWSLLLLLLITAAWVLWAIAAAAAVAVDDARKGVPEGRRRGVSAAPVIPVFPVGFWLLALAVDLVAAPWGSRAVGALHAALAAVFVVTLVRDVVRLRQLEGQGKGKGAQQGGDPQGGP